MTKPASSLLINGLELSVHLGWPDKELMHEQTVLLDVDIWFPKPPKGCLTDHLDDTICYADLIHTIRTKIAGKNFHLIEHLAHAIYNTVKPRLPNKARLIVRITKHPKIPGLSGHVRFSYWDDR